MSNKNISTRGNRGLADCNHAPLRALFNRTLISGALAIGATATKIKTTVAMTFVNGGLLLAKATMADQAVTIAASDDDSTSQAAGTTCYYVYCLDASGNVTCYKGVDDVAAYPAIPDDLTPFGVAKIVNAAATAFTLGTTAYNAASVTTTWTNVSHVPAAVV